MLDRQFDAVNIGHNYLSYFLSLELLQRYSNVLLLDDNRFNFGDMFTDSFGELEKNCLTKWPWPATLNLNLDFKHFLSQKNTIFYIGKKRIVLGRLPSQNLNEILRKFHFGLKGIDPFLNSVEKEQFDQQYFDFIEKVSSDFVHWKGPYELKRKFNLWAPQGLRRIWPQFLEMSQNPDAYLNVQEASEWRTLLFMLRCFFHYRLSTRGSELELLHLFLSLLSPNYELKHSQFLVELSKVFEASGGNFRRLNLAELKMEKGEVKSFELSNFEGVIAPKKMCFIGGQPLEMEVKLSKHLASYSCLKVVLYLEENTKFDVLDSKIVFSSSHKIGTDRPLWEASFEADKVHFNVLLAKRLGSKVSFVKEAILQMLESDLRFLYPHLDFRIKNSTIDFTLDVFIEDRPLHQNQLGKWWPFKKSVLDLGLKISPLTTLKLKNVYYVGPYGEESLGSLSSLMQIKRIKDRV